MKIVVADDEQWVRLGLISMIQEMETAWEVAGEAKDGEELVELTSAIQPEAAIVDIRMPGLNGIEAIRKARLLSPLTRWIILTGYSDFEYARQALQMGVSDYLLKPVNPEELEKVVTHISQGNRLVIQQLNQQFENQLFSLLHGMVSLESANGLLRNGVFTGGMVLIDTSGSPADYAELQTRWLQGGRQVVQQNIVYGVHLALLPLPGGELVWVGVRDPHNSESERCLQRLEAEILSSVKQLRSEVTALTVAETGEAAGFSEFQQRLKRLQERAYLRVAADGLDRRWTLQELEDLERSDGSLVLKAAKLALQLQQEFKNGLYMKYQTTLQELERFLTRAAADERRGIEVYLRKVFPDITRSDASGRSTGLTERLRLLGEDLLAVGQVAEPPDVVKQVLAYIERNYMNNIGISQIAGELNMTQSYLSTLFHKRTGTTFIKHLTQVRILKAKELLTKTNLQVGQVAEEVGYYSTRHFTKLFTEIVGIYPSDFKKSQSSR
ncbi:response regulator transcription factor [Paenibacillus sedimenti]|uniref:Response regulator n=1 Tax=Paenibacillus sedimenti TaxID=2770274 RepID=A0A926QLL6_9BACL|nr:response regulator [Paenibacillus sedimenti]MBD0382539.1 response regulator [Paenibacillus sedimenti]